MAKKRRTKAQKLESCVQQVKRSGKSKSAAFAICQAAMKRGKKR